MTLIEHINILGLCIVAVFNSSIGFIIYYSDKKSTTNRTFLFFAMTTLLWVAINYCVLQTRNDNIALFLIRLNMLMALWHLYFFFKLFYVFPNRAFIPSIKFKILSRIFAVMSLFTLTPYVIKSLKTKSQLDLIPEINPGIGIIFFGLIVTVLIYLGLYFIFKNINKLKTEKRKSLYYILIFIAALFFLIVTSNFVMPAILNNTTFISFGLILSFPLIISTGYIIYIYNYSYLNLKIVITYSLVFLVCVFSFIDFIFSKDTNLLLLKGSMFFLNLALGVYLVKATFKEIEVTKKFVILNDYFQKTKQELKNKL